MKILVAGAGLVAAELLKRLGESWQVTLLDKDDSRLGVFSSRFVSVVRVLSGDASSPVVLKEADIGEQDCVLALTDDDASNLAIASFAKRKGVKNIMALVYDPERVRRFHDLRIGAVPVTSVVARRIYHYLQNPRIQVLPIGQDEGELLEVEVGPDLSAMGKRIGHYKGQDWRIVGVLRDNRLLFPRTESSFRAGDRLLVLGKPGLIDDVCSAMQLTEAHFPLVYGQELLLGIPHEGDDISEEILSESLHLAQNTQVRGIRVICDPEVCSIEQQVTRWSESLDIRLISLERSLPEQVRETCRTESVGLVVLPPLKNSFVSSFMRAPTVELAHALPCPLMIARRTHPYERILVPFGGSAAAELALEVAIDLAQQLGAEVSAVVVQEPEFLHREEAENRGWAKGLLGRVRELSHTHKKPIHEMVRRGNPVREISRMAESFNPMVIGSTNPEKEFFTPHVGELLVRKSPCSVLIVTP